MQVFYGPTPLGPPGSVAISTSAQTEISQTGRPVSVLKTANLTGTLKCADGLDTAAAQADIKAQTLALIAALAVWNQNLILRMDSGDESAVVLKAADSLSGVQVINPPSFPSEPGAMHGSYLKWSCTIQSKEAWTGEGAEALENVVVSFQEKVAYSGGGPKRISRPGVNGLNDRTTIFPFMPHVCTQSGQAVGLRRYPQIPPPLYPDLLDDEPQIERTGPVQVGLALENYAISWTYVMSSPGRLPDALPHFWRSV